MEDKLVLFDEEGNIIHEGFNNDEDSGLNAQDSSTFTKENIALEGNFVDKLVFKLSRKGK